MQKRLLFSVVLSLTVAACSPASGPFDLSFDVAPNAAGAEISVLVRGGNPRAAWVGFAAGPGAPVSVVERATNVRATSLAGESLAIARLADGAYRVDHPGLTWRLSYELSVKPLPGAETFYRTSVRGPDLLVLVGSDALPRFYVEASGVESPPYERAAGPVAAARVAFALPQDWRVATTARALDRQTFELDEHPVGSVFAVGPYELLPAINGLRIAVHRDWHVMPNAIAGMTDDLLTALEGELGRPTEAAALALMNPLPDLGVEARGLQTAGMVRGETLVLYAGATAAAHNNADIVRDAMAVFVGHELFHLYVPSRVQVSRELSWLSEGWAMHMGKRAAVAAGWLSEDSSRERLHSAYRRYIDIGGYRAGSLPAASMGTESQRDLLYVRGELVFALLAEEWRRSGRSSGDPRSFEQSLWHRLIDASSGNDVLTLEQVRAVLNELVRPLTVRRYVEGTAPITLPALGLPLH